LAWPSRKRGEHSANIYPPVRPHTGKSRWWQLALRRIDDHAQNREWQRKRGGKPCHHMALHIGRRSTARLMEGLLF
jgi:hypothetical protein